MMRAREWLAVASVLCVNLVIYGSTVTAGYVYEDRRWVRLEAADGADAGLSLSARALGPWTFAAMAGWSAAAHHAVSLLLALAVGLLTRTWLRLIGLSAMAATVGLAVVLLHPLAVETTAYIASRNELLAAVLVLAACCLAARPAWEASVLACGIALVAATAKEHGLLACAFVPAVMAGVGRRWRAAACACVLAGAGYAVWGARVWEVVRWGHAGVGASLVTPDLWLRWQATAAAHLLALLPVPVGNTVAYDVEAVPAALQWLSVAWLALLAGVAVWLWRRSAQAAAGLAWMLAVIAPRLWVIVPNGPLNEHQFYLALPGAALIVAAAWDHFSPMEVCDGGRTARA